MLDGAILKPLYKLSKESCKGECQRVPGGLCHAFVYEASKKYCNLHSKINSDNNIKEATGKVFGLKYCSGKKYDIN